MISQTQAAEAELLMGIIGCVVGLLFGVVCAATWFYLRYAGFLREGNDRIGKARKRIAEKRLTLKFREDAVATREAALEESRNDKSASPCRVCSVGRKTPARAGANRGQRATAYSTGTEVNLLRDFSRQSLKSVGTGSTVSRLG